MSPRQFHARPAAMRYPNVGGGSRPLDTLGYQVICYHLAYLLAHAASCLGARTRGFARKLWHCLLLALFSCCALTPIIPLQGLRARMRPDGNSSSGGEGYGSTRAEEVMPHHKVCTACPLPKHAPSRTCTFIPSHIVPAFCWLCMACDGSQVSIGLVCSVHPVPCACRAHQYLQTVPIAWPAPGSI